MPQLTPPIYATGRFVVVEPFALVENVDYSCQAIRTFLDCQERGIDVFKDVYGKHGIGTEKFLEDKAAGINIISLQSEGRDTVYIPDSYIASYPNMGEAIPQRLIISVDLGIISSHWDATYLISKIQNLASDVVGEEPDVALHSIPVHGRAAANDVPSLDAVRAIDVSNRSSDHARNLELEKTNSLLRERVLALESMLINQ